jgi:ABC-2 type transport system ATP-binding protein
MDSLVELADVTKRFGAITAVDAMTFAVGRGDVLGFLGPNGAGKTTTMRLITGFLPPDAGRVHVCGGDVVALPVEAKRRIGYLPEGAPLYADMTPAGLLDFIARVRGLHGAARRRRIDDAVHRLHLGGVLAQPIGTLSKGFKRRVGLAQAILHDPEVLILDEPTDGLDPNQKHDVRALLREMARDKAIIISTHILEEVEALCTRALVVARGRLVADTSPEALLARSRFHNAVALRVATRDADRAAGALRALGDVAEVETTPCPDDTTRIIAVPDRERGEQPRARALLDRAQGAVEGAGIAIQEVALERGRLEDVFRSLTAEEA